LCVHALCVREKAVMRCTHSRAPTCTAVVGRPLAVRLSCSTLMAPTTHGNTPWHSTYSSSGLGAPANLVRQQQHAHCSNLCGAASDGVSHSARRRLRFTRIRNSSQSVALPHITARHLLRRPGALVGRVCQQQHALSAHFMRRATDNGSSQRQAPAPRLTKALQNHSNAL